MENKLKVSIIVPVYNVVNFLPQCIESLMAQSYGNIELIFIDDGSTDGSSNVLDEYGTKDLRIHVLHQPNSGVSTARNKGIEIATGDYCCFVDGDDNVCPNYIAEMLKYVTGGGKAGMLWPLRETGKNNNREVKVSSYVLFKSERGYNGNVTTGFVLGCSVE